MQWRLACSIAVALLLLKGAAASNESVPIRWSPTMISSPAFESHAAFDPITGDLYFVRSSTSFTGWQLRVSHCTPAGWSAPEAPDFAAAGLEADPWFTPDGQALYFISNRTTDGVSRSDLDIWTVRRDDAGRWGVPVRLPAPVNSTAQEWYPRLAPDGWLYFGSGRPGGQGKTDIWRAREGAYGQWAVQNLGPQVNTPGDEFEALPTDDGRALILMTNRGLYRLQRTDTGWSTPQRLPEAVNRNGSEVGVTLSPSGRTLLFARDTGPPDSGEFFIWHLAGTEDWPPDCPAGRRAPQ